MAKHEITKHLNIPNNFRVGLRVTVKSACYQRVHLAVDDVEIGTWEANGRRELHHSEFIPNQFPTTFFIRIEHNCVPLPPYTNRWEPSDIAESMISMPGANVWHVGSEDGRDKNYTDAIINVYISRPIDESVIRDDADGTERVASILPSPADLDFSEMLEKEAERLE